MTEPKHPYVREFADRRRPSYRCHAQHNGHHCELPQGHYGPFHRAPVEGEHAVRWSDQAMSWLEHRAAAYRHEHACADCPVGGRGSNGTACPNAAACDASCELQMAHEEEPDGWTGTWCAACGPDVKSDPDGTCQSCGRDCVGEGVEAALKLREELRSLREGIGDLVASLAKISGIEEL